MGAPFLRKYATGTGADIYVPMIKRGVVDFAVGADWTTADGDIKISIDGGAAANIATRPVAIAMGNTAYWKYVFSDGELTGKKMVVTVADSATKAVEDQMFYIETFGHASAAYISDLSAAALSTAAILTALGSAGGLDVLLAAIQADTDNIQTRIPAALTTDGNMKADVLRLGGTVQTGRDIGASVLLSAAYDAAKTAATQASVDTIDDFLDTEIAAIKAKTDSLTFTVAGKVDAQIKGIGTVAIVGDGAGTPWNHA